MYLDCSLFNLLPMHIAADYLKLKSITRNYREQYPVSLL